MWKEVVCPADFDVYGDFTDTTTTTRSKEQPKSEGESSCLDDHVDQKFLIGQSILNCEGFWLYVRPRHK